jgi:ribosome-binding factor A
MAGRPKRSSGRPSGRGGGGHAYPRTARLNETLREIIAEELVRIQDERLEFVTVTSIDVDSELNRAFVYFDSLAGSESDDELVDALVDHRARLQSSIARQIRTKKTPILEFRPDGVLRSAERIDDILRADRARDRGQPAADETDHSETPDAD